MLLNDHVEEKGKEKATYIMILSTFLPSVHLPCSASVNTGKRHHASAECNCGRDDERSSEKKVPSMKSKLGLFS